MISKLQISRMIAFRPGARLVPPSGPSGGPPRFLLLSAANPVSEAAFHCLYVLSICYLAPLHDTAMIC